MPDPTEFYNRVYQTENYANFSNAAQHFAFRQLKDFIETYDLSDSRCLEVGSGRGAFQDVVKDYTGIDLSASVQQCYHKPFYNGSAEVLPFPDADFDAIWSITVLEHVPNPEAALLEMRRVLRDGGFLFLMPAWNCRPWICEGIPVRSYRDLTLRQKCVKLSLPIRDSLLFRASHTLPKRLWNLLRNGSLQDIPLRFGRLKADYERFWTVDSDACSSIDPFDVIQWFRSRGDTVVSHSSEWATITARSEPVVVIIHK